MLVKNERWAGRLGVLVLFCFVCLGLLATPCSATGTTPVFSDVGEGEPNALFIKYLKDRGIMNGFPDGTFHPRQGLTRAEAAVLMVRTGGVQSGSNLSGFGDVPASHWAASSIAAAVEAGYVKGYPDGSFRPEQKLSRVEAVALLLRLSKQEHTARLPLLSDLDESHWAAGAVAEALASGMAGIEKENHSFRPDLPMLRSDLARALAVLITYDAELYQTGLPCELKIKKGSIKVIRNGEELAAEPAMAIEIGDRIQVGKNGEAELTFPDGSGFYLQENTDLLVKESRGRSYIINDGTAGVATDWFNVELKQGKLFGALATNNQIVPEQDNQAYLLQDELTIASAGGGLGYIAAAQQKQPWYLAKTVKKVRVKVDMPWGVAAIRGTFWGNEVSEGGKSGTSLLIGDGELRAGGQTVKLGEGQQTAVGSRNGQPSQLREMSLEQIRAWEQACSWSLERAKWMARQFEAILPPPPAPLREGEPPVRPPHNPEPAPSGEEERLIKAFQEISYLDEPKSSSSHRTPSVLIDRISDQTVTVNKSLIVNIVSRPSDAVLTVDNNSNPSVVTASLSEKQLTLEGKFEGEATITLKASKSGYRDTSIEVNVEVIKDEGVWEPIPPGVSVGTWSIQDAVVLNEGKTVTRALTIECDPTYDFASYDVKLFKNENEIKKTVLIGYDLDVSQPFYYMAQVLNEECRSDIFIKLTNDEGSSIYALLDDNGILTNASTRTISGTISLPAEQKAPKEGLYVTFWMNGGTKFGNYWNHGKLFIPAEQSSTSFEFSVPVDDSNSNGYRLSYELNSNYMGNTVLRGGYESISVINGDAESINIQVSEGAIVSGTLSIGPNVTEGLVVGIFGDYDHKRYVRCIEIKPGAEKVPFSLAVPPGLNYIFSYCALGYEDITSGLLNRAYYKGDEMTPFEKDAQSVLVEDNLDEINLSLLEGVNLSGTIDLPTGIEAPEEGLEVRVRASVLDVWGNPKICATTRVTIPGGESEVDYHLTIPKSIGEQYQVSASAELGLLYLQQVKAFVLADNQDAVNLSLTAYPQSGYLAEDVVPNSILVKGMETNTTYTLQSVGSIDIANLNYSSILYLKTPIKTAPDTYEDCWFDLGQARNSEYLIKSNALTNTDQFLISDMVKDLDAPVRIDTAYARNKTVALTFSRPIESAENQVDGSPTRITLNTDQGSTEYNLCIRQGENDPLMLDNIEVPNIANSKWKAVLTVPDLQYNQEYSVVLYQGTLDGEDMVTIAEKTLAFKEPKPEQQGSVQY